MRTILKRADELAGGDVARLSDTERLIVANARDIGDYTELLLVRLGVADLVSHRAEYLHDSQFTVEAPDELTPAQQHADKLLEAARDVLQQHRDGMLPELGFLRGAVELVDPPKPVTLAEALNALRKLEEAARQVQFGEMDRQSIQVERLRARALLARPPGEQNA